MDLVVAREERRELGARHRHQSLHHLAGVDPALGGVLLHVEAGDPLRRGDRRGRRRDRARSSGAGFRTGAARPPGRGRRRPRRCRWSSRSSSAPAPRMAWQSHTTGSSCSSSVARYALSTMCRSFLLMTLAPQSPVGMTSVLSDSSMKRAKSAGLPRRGPGMLALHAALVDAEAAVRPSRGVAPRVLRGVAERRDPVAGQRMVLFLAAASVHGVGVRLLPREGERDRALVGEDVDVDGRGAARRRSAAAPWSSARSRTGGSISTKVRVFPVVMASSSALVPERLGPVSRASITTSSGAGSTPAASAGGAMPRSRSEKSSASTRTPRRARRRARRTRRPGRAGSTPFWTRKSVTRRPSAASCAASS